MISYLVYISVPSLEVEAVDLLEILRQSRENNAREGITGLLVYKKHYFCQYIEGRREAIDRLYERIQLDSRHRTPFVIDSGTLEKRLFPDWTMGYADTSYLKKLDVAGRNEALFPDHWEVREEYANIAPVKILSHFGSNAIE